jgi:hypothetical protein
LKNLKQQSLLGRVALVVGILVVAYAVVFGIRAQLGNVIVEGVVPGNPETERLALSGESISPSDAKTAWLGAVTRNPGIDRETAIRLSDEFLRAIRLAPNDYKWWIERGRALEKARRFDEAESHFLKAVTLAPRYSSPRWHLGNFYLRVGKRESSIEHFAIAAQGDAQYREEIFAIIDDFFENPATDFARIVGSDSDMIVTLSKYHASRGKFQASLSAWNLLSIAEKRNQEVFGLVIAQAMFDKGAYLAAAEVLRDLQKEDARSGVISDGSFESSFRNPKDVFFGWRVSSRDRVDVRADGRNAKDGKRSLRISYNGTIQVFVNNVAQIIPVKPDTKYRLSFWTKGEGIRSAGPPRLDIIDPTGSGVLVSSQSLKGTFDWNRAILEFTVPEGLEGVLLAVNREGCGPECPIYGVLWLDALVLEVID